ncbi:MAG: glycosyltransferase family 4 protein [Candidatus Acidiferrales bacterium]
MKTLYPQNQEGPTVLFFSTFVSHESGASYALRKTIRNVAARGVRPVVVVPDSADSREMFPTSEFDAVYLKIERPRRTRNPLIQGHWAANSISTFLSLRRLIRERRVDLVHCNEITDFIAGIAAKSCGVPSVCHVRTDRPPNPYRSLLLATLNQVASAVVVPAKSTAAWVIADRMELTRRTHVIYDWAFDVSAYESATGRAATRRELAIRPDEIMVLLVSKLVSPKGHECFVRAAENVRQAGKDIRFVVVGGPVSGHEKEAAAIKRLAEELIPAPALQFIGPRSDLPALYAASDIAVHCPIYADPYPTVVLLAMAAGKPVIGSLIGGIPEQIEHNSAGVLVPANDSDALAGAILNLARDPARRESLGAAAKRWVRENFTPEKQGRLLARVYAQVLAANPLKHDSPAGSALTGEEFVEARDQVDA